MCIGILNFKSLIKETYYHNDKTDLQLFLVSSFCHDLGRRCILSSEKQIFMKRIISFLSGLLFLNLSFGQFSETTRDWQPVTLNVDTTTIFMEDLFIDATVVDSITGPDWLDCKLNKNNNTILLTVSNEDIPPIGVINFYTPAVKNQPNKQLLVQRSKRQVVKMQFNPKGEEFQSVGIVGDMNGWNATATPMELKDGIWQTTIMLNPGRYAYQFVCDGIYRLDPANENKVSNGMGGTNSMIDIGEADRSRLPFYYVKSADENFVTLGHVNRKIGDPVFIVWNNVLVPFDDGDDIRFRIPAIMENIEFKNMRVYGYNENGTGNDLLIPFNYKSVVRKPNLIPRSDWHKSIMYFLMVDRFANGDPANDKPIDDDRLDPKTNYMGGDLAGIMEKVQEDYFTELGFNTLWLSPVFQNPREAYMEYPEPHRWFAGYHGYWPISLSKVDDRFGTNEEYKALVDTLHNRDMNIVLDYIANHVHSEHPLWTEHPDWFSNLDLPDGRKNLRLWEEQRLTTWFEPYMPSLDHAQPIVAEASADSAIWWLKEYGIDGFRHDATKHIEIEFWRLLTRKINLETGRNDVYQIGETFGNRELIGSYIGTGLLDAQFDFNLYFDMRNILAQDEGSFEELSSSLHHTFNYYGYHNLMGNITGNHDLPRFISYAGKGLKWNEDDKEAGWEREIKVEDPAGYKKLSMLHAFIMTIPGIPIVYYGDEIGMAGAGDPDNRRMMDFRHLGPNKVTVRNTLRQLTRLRNEHMALLYGDFKEIAVSPTTWVYSRHYLDDHILVVMNKDSKDSSFDIPLNNKLLKHNWRAVFNTPFSEENDAININLPAHSFEIFVSENEDY